MQTTDPSPNKSCAPSICRRGLSRLGVSSIATNRSEPLRMPGSRYPLSELAKKLFKESPAAGNGGENLRRHIGFSGVAIPREQKCHVVNLSYDICESSVMDDLFQRARLAQEFGEPHSFHDHDGIERLRRHSRA
jgi:hypothetical protein